MTLPQRQSQRWSLVSERLAIVAFIGVLTIGFLTRVFLLDGQSLWYDEGVSVVMAPRDLATITANAAGDIHPPLYYYLLHFWTGLAGASEFGARFLSVIYGVILVAVVFQFARRLFGTAAALAGAFVVATSPFLIYYSQEARMYMQVTALAALSTYLFSRLTVSAEDQPSNPRRFEWVAYCVATALTLYSHYFGFTVLVFQNAYFWILSGRQRSLWVPWLASQFAVVTAFSPWMAVSLSQFSSWPSISEPFTLQTLLWRVFRIFSFGLSVDGGATPRRELIFILTLAASLLYLPLAERNRGFRNLALLALYGLVPVLTMYALSLQRPMYNPKFLLLATPAYYCALGLGAASLGRVANRLVLSIHLPRASSIGPALNVLVTLAALAGISYGTYHSVSAYYFDPKYARDDYRGLVRYIEKRAQPGDVIVLNAPGQIEIFDYYYKGDAPRVPLPKERPIDEKSAEQELEKIASAYQRVWLVLWAVPEADPRSFIEGWLDQHSYKSVNNWFGSVRLCLYANQQSGNALKKDANLQFGDGMRLLSYEIDSDQFRSGDIVPLTLNWEATDKIADRYKVFAHILDGNGMIYGQRDSEPGGGARPTDSLTPGETLLDRYGIPVLAGTPPGGYMVEFGLYHPKTGQRLPIKNSSGEAVGDRVLVGPIHIDRAPTAPDPEVLGMEQKLDVTFDGKLKLMGYSIDAIGQQPDFVDYSANDTLNVTLFWQAVANPTADYGLQIVAQSDQAQGQKMDSADALAGGFYPPTQWQPGEVIRDQHKLPLGGLNGDCTLSIALRPASDQLPVDVSPKTPAHPYINLGKIRVTHK